MFQGLTFLRKISFKHYVLHIRIIFEVKCIQKKNEKKKIPEKINNINVFKVPVVI